MRDLPAEFWHGVNQFNQREFYACHDTLEALWMEAIDPDRTFYQGILQIAVAFYHLSNQNWHGAVTLLGEGTGRLRTYRPEYEGVNIEQLVRQSQTILRTLQLGGPESTMNYAAKLASDVQNTHNQESNVHILEIPIIELI